MNPYLLIIFGKAGAAAKGKLESITVKIIKTGSNNLSAPENYSRNGNFGKQEATLYLLLPNLQMRQQKSLTCCRQGFLRQILAEG
jgi:hypothetical protein